MSNQPHRREHAPPAPASEAPPSGRREVKTGFPPRSARSLADALRDALLKLETERQTTTGRTNPEDDDEDPTRRLGHDEGASSS